MAPSSCPARPRWSPSPRRSAELYAQKEPGVDIKVDGPGTGDGFKLFCDGETDISNASRAIKDEEADTCARQRHQLCRAEVGLRRDDRHDQPCQRRRGVPEFQRSLCPHRTRGQRGRHLGGRDAASPRSWARPPSCPMRRSEIFGPGAESGTYDSFIEIALADPEEVRLDEGYDHRGSGGHHPYRLQRVGRRQHDHHRHRGQ